MSNLVTQFTISNENTTTKEVVTATRDASAEILKEMAGAFKEILNAKTSTTNTQSSEMQESTQILVEKETENLKQSMIQIWNAKLQKRVSEFCQMIRNENTVKVYKTWKNNSPAIIPRKLEMKSIKGEQLHVSQTQLREKQVMFNVHS